MERSTIWETNLADLSVTQIATMASKSAAKQNSVLTPATTEESARRSTQADAVRVLLHGALRDTEYELTVTAAPPW